MPTTSLVVAQKPNYVHAIQQTRTTRGPSDQSPFVKFFADCCESAAHQTHALESRMSNVLDAWHANIPKGDRNAAQAIEAFARMPVMTEGMLTDAIGKDSGTTLETLLDAKVVSLRPSRLTGANVYVADKALSALEAAQQMRSLGVQASRKMTNDLPTFEELRARARQREKSLEPVKTNQEHPSEDNEEQPSSPK